MDESAAVENKLLTEGEFSFRGNDVLKALVLDERIKENKMKLFNRQSNVIRVEIDLLITETSEHALNLEKVNCQEGIMSLFDGTKEIVSDDVMELVKSFNENTAKFDIAKAECEEAFDKMWLGVCNTFNLDPDAKWTINVAKRQVKLSKPASLLDSLFENGLPSPEEMRKQMKEMLSE